MKKIIENRIRDSRFTLIAEIGVNYYDIAKAKCITPIEAAKLMIKEAAGVGVHAVKFQTYKAETLASKDSPSYWDIKEEPTKSQYELFRRFDSFGLDEYKELAHYSENCGVEFLSTAFDVVSADYLDSLMNVYKVSSSDLNNYPFVEYQAKKNKPMILSVGASRADEIEKAVATVRKYNDKPLTLLHCVLEYPTPYEHANLNRILALKESFPDVVVGYSDHTRPDQCADVIKTAYLLGSSVVEKHFTLDKTLPGNDHYHAMDPADAKRIIEGISFIDKIRGNGKLDCSEFENMARRNARRSLVATKKINEGAIIRADMLTWKRPGTGVSVEYYDDVIGSLARCDIDEDTVLQKEMITWKKEESQ